MQTELDDSVGLTKTKVTGQRNFKVHFYETNHNYSINQGNVLRVADGEISTSTEGIALTYEVLLNKVRIYTVVDGYDEDYYEYLTEAVLKNEKDWYDREFDTIAEMTQWCINKGWNIERTYNSLKEWYLAEHSDYESCAEWAWDWLVDLTKEEKDEALALIPNYYVTVTCNNEIKSINLADTTYAEFIVPKGGTYQASAKDVQTLSTSEASIEVPFVFFRLPGRMVSNSRKE